MTTRVIMARYYGAQTWQSTWESPSVAPVRPQLEWVPHTQSNINKIEAVQRRAARFVIGDYRLTSSVSSMLEHLGWGDFHTRRQHGKMVLMYRIVNNLVEMPASITLQPIRTSRTRGHNHRYLMPYCSVDAYKFAFFPSEIRLWTVSLLRHSVPSLSNHSRL